MKLKNELPEMEKRFSAVLEKLKEYAPALYVAGEYRDFITRLSWDTLRACYTPAEICAWYEKYNCSDAHITSAARAALIAVYPAAADIEKGGTNCKFDGAHVYTVSKAGARDAVTE